LPDVTVVADAGMISESNQKDIEEAGLSFILGMKVPSQAGPVHPLSGGAKTVSRELEAKARELAGLKGYLTNLAACPTAPPSRLASSSAPTTRSSRSKKPSACSSRPAQSATASATRSKPT
jgi:hypothetical protein